MLVKWHKLVLGECQEDSKPRITILRRLIHQLLRKVKYRPYKSQNKAQLKVQIISHSSILTRNLYLCMLMWEKEVVPLAVWDPKSIVWVNTSTMFQTMSRQQRQTWFNLLKSKTSLTLQMLQRILLIPVTCQIISFQALRSILGKLLWLQGSQLGLVKLKTIQQVKVHLQTQSKHNTQCQHTGDRTQQLPSCQQWHLNNSKTQSFNRVSKVSQQLRARTTIAWQSAWVKKLNRSL